MTLQNTQPIHQLKVGGLQSRTVSQDMLETTTLMASAQYVFGVDYVVLLLVQVVDSVAY